MPVRMSAKRKSDRINFDLRKIKKKKTSAIIRAINGLLRPKEIILTKNSSKAICLSRILFALCANYIRF
jgi:hypothetical protein